MKSASLQFLHALGAALLQFFERAEANGLRGAGLGAGRDEPRSLAVIAKRAFKSAAIAGAPIDHAEGTIDDAVATTVTNVGLNIDGTDLGAHDRAGGT